MKCLETGKKLAPGRHLGLPWRQGNPSARVTQLPCKHVEKENEMCEHLGNALARVTLPPCKQGRVFDSLVKGNLLGRSVLTFSRNMPLHVHNKGYNQIQLCMVAKVFNFHDCIFVHIGIFEVKLNTNEQLFMIHKGI